MTDLYEKLLTAFGGDIPEAEEPTTITLGGGTYICDLAAKTMTAGPIPEHTAALIAEAIADAQENGVVSARQRWRIEKSDATVVIEYVNFPKDAIETIVDGTTREGDAF
jgi:hypothetical protein